MNQIYISYFIGGAMLIMELIGLIVSIILPVLDRWNKRYFIILFSVLLLTLAVCFIDLMVFMDPSLAAAEKTIVFFEGLLLATLAFMPTQYLLHCYKKNWRHCALFYIEITLFGVFFILLLLAQFLPFFYYVTPQNIFFRGPGFPLLLMPIIAMIATNLVAVIRMRKVLSKKMLFAFLIYLVPMMVGIFVHMFVFAFLYVDISLLLSSFTMFCVILMEQIKQDRLQQTEIAHQQANILILQMRPHFIYNSLTSIYYLCEQDPKKAQKVIQDFTTYLRKNFTAISSEVTVPFSEELAHTKAYLAVECTQHEDLLFIDYDTPHTHFRIPPLTLQPIVENSIKHGMDPDAEPLHISVQTRRTDAGSEIIVTDNGAGFDPKEDSDSPSALSNIQQRLQMMCNGTITITPRKEGGTVVTVFIPEQNE